MNCFFLGKSGNGNGSSKEGLVSFSIPDLGVAFKTRYFGSFFECEYMSFLALLSFIEKNPKIFKKQKVNIYSDNPLIVYQVNQKSFCSRDLKSHRDKALVYKKRFSYSLEWIPSDENRAREMLAGESAVDEEVNLRLGFLAQPTSEKFCAIDPR